jgi:uncharacterized repeat protein (TIGR02543 family)
VESPAISLLAPVRSGYTFGGWYDNGAFSGTAVTGIPAGSTGNKAFYARWLLIYAIEYTLNGGTNAPANPEGYTVEDTITLAAPTRSGYTFNGWYNNAAFSGTAVTTIPAGSTGNKAFYAKWTVITYTITYTLNGGTGATANPVGYTVEDTINLTAPTRSDYTFGGWYDNPGFSGSTVTTIPAGSTGNKHFYARWVKTQVLTLSTDQGEGAFSQDTFTIQRSGGTSSKTIVLEGGWSSVEWYVDVTRAVEAPEANGSIIIKAANYTPGPHTLTAVVGNAQGSWSRTISFTVE